MAADETPPNLPDLQSRYREAAARAESTMLGSLPGTPAEALRRLADEVDRLPEPHRWDRYGERGPVQLLEQHVAELLHKPAAVMFPSGVMAQQATLRVWCDRAGSTRVALPELSHLLQHELDGPRLLHGFRFELLTRGSTVPRVEHLDAVPGRLGAVLVELPLRDAGYLLPTWDELEALSKAARSRDVPLHFDGARLWESQPFLGHDLSAIAALADSVYVSFYKGLRGLAGAAVACDGEMAAELRHWRTRHGGTLFTLLPYAVSALRGLREELPRMAEYHVRAQQLARALTERGLRVMPELPHVNAFRLLAPHGHEEILGRVVTTLEQERLLLTPPWEEADVPGWSFTEFVVGAATMEWSVEEVADRLTRVALAGD